MTRSSGTLIAILTPLLLAACERGAPKPPTASAPEPASTNRKALIFLGDSLTAGFGVAAEEAYPSLLAERWEKEGRTFSVRNAGVSGSTSAGVLENLDWTLGPDTAVVFLAVGANDGLRGLNLEQTRRNIGKILAVCQKRKIKAVLAGMKLPPNYGPDYARRFESLYQEAAAAAGIPLLPFLLEGVGGHPEMNLEDGIHPNRDGHARIADTVDKFFKQESLLP